VVVAFAVLTVAAGVRGVAGPEILGLTLVTTRAMGVAVEPADALGVLLGIATYVKLPTCFWRRLSFSLRCCHRRASRGDRASADGWPKRSGEGRRLRGVGRLLRRERRAHTAS